jgi:PAS domain S-box-containing protein
MNNNSTNMIDIFQKNSPFAIVITNYEGVIEVVNDKAEAMFGYGSQELRGKTIEVLVPKSQRENHIKHRSMNKSKSYTRTMGLGLDLRGLRKNGEEFLVEIGLHANHNKDQIISYIIDITKRKQIEQHQLNHFVIEKKGMDQELKLAHKVQVDLLPKDIPKIPGWSFAVNWVPAEEVSGDFYDLVQSKVNYVDLVIADVSDKGVPAALYMAFLSTLLRKSINGNSSLVKVIQSNNKLMCLESSQNMLVSLILTRLNTVTGEISYVNAGHNQPLVYSSSRDQISRLNNSNMMLGLDPHATFKQYDYMINPGDFILFYTDGVTEAWNDQKLFFGDDLFQQVLSNYRHDDPEIIVNGIFKAICEFTAPSIPSDDITIMIAKRL